MQDNHIADRFEAIYNSTNKMALKFISSKCKRVSDVADIFQDTYLELYQVMSKRGVEYVTNSEAFVLWLAKKKIARYYSFIERLGMLVSFGSEVGEGSIEYEHEAFATEDFVVNHVMLTAAQQFIESKPQDVQKIFFMHYELGLNLGEIAKALEMKEPTAKSKLYRTLKELRRILE
ncbi:MAG: RNA polymerase sigma factor [Defluviitaleaceae bacterium]|nr:RNA polymerase sigma factor [Defluviitaleaceae bacterium]